MIAVFRKEIAAFFSSLTAYLFTGVFLLLSGFVLFVYPPSSLLDSNYASLQALFDNAPLLFLFLIPAITMRSFAEEQQEGTIEFLATKPLPFSGIVYGKYFAALTLAVFALLPTLFYAWTVYELGAPRGNLDLGALAGSYIGLLLLAAVFTAAGIFASALVANQIAAFVLAALLCFLLLNGFDFISALPVFSGKGDDIVEMLGIQYHYRALSRGVIDSRDLLYFLSLIAFFLAFTHWIWDKRSGNTKSIRFLLLTGILLFVNMLGNARFEGRALYGYLDLTADKRFTLTRGTKALLRGLDDVVYVKVLLGGAFPAGFKRLQTAATDMLEDFRSENGLIEYDFEDPFAGPANQVNDRLEAYRKEGLQPISLRLPGQSETTTKAVLPYALVYYKGRNIAVNLMEGGPGVNEESLNKAVRFLEYKLANAVQQLKRPDKAAIVFTAGHGELEPFQTADLERALRQFYNTGRVVLDSVANIDPRIAALIIAKPRAGFSEKDKFKLDQYIMNGGKVLWLLDPLAIDLDSLNGRSEYIPSEYQTGLADLLFYYGIRIQPNLVLDMQCTPIELVTGMIGDQPQFQLFEYPYHTVSTPNTAHPIVKNLGPVNFFYPASIDTAVKTRIPLKRTVLLASSPRSRYQYTPVRMNFEFMKYPLDPSKFDKGPQPLALLLEGSFSSMYENRVSPAMAAGLEAAGTPFRAQSPPNRMIVVSDGDVAKNGIDAKRREVVPLGYNRFARYVFDNKDFLLNAIEYLLDETGVAEARGKNVDLRLLDTARAKTERLKWQLFNFGVPLAALAIFGILYQTLRRRKYARD
jgi:ABC-2 type transport system permease protein